MNQYLRRLFVGAILCCSSFPSAHASDKLLVYTEHFPPYSFLDAAGELTGVATKRVHQLLSASNIPYNIQLLSWPRALRNASNAPNALIYGMVRTTEREKVFDFLVPLVIDEYHLIGRKADTREVTAEQIQNGAFTAVCLQDDISCTLLIEAGFPRKNIIQFASLSGVVSATTMLESGRADFYVDTMYRYRTPPDTTGEETSLRPAYKLGPAILHLAANKKMSVKYKRAISNAYKRLQQSGEFKPFMAVIASQNP